MKRFLVLGMVFLASPMFALSESTRALVEQLRVKTSRNEAPIPVVVSQPTVNAPPSQEAQAIQIPEDDPPPVDERGVRAYTGPSDEDLINLAEYNERKGKQKPSTKSKSLKVKPAKKQKGQKKVKGSKKAKTGKTAKPKK